MRQHAHVDTHLPFCPVLVVVVGGGLRVPKLRSVLACSLAALPHVC